MRAITKALRQFFGFEGLLSKRQRLHTAARLGVEPMEDRVVPATFLVTSTGDSVNDTGSLRYAITQANLTPDADEILFDSGLSGQTISIQALPRVTRALTITGPGATRLTLQYALPFNSAQNPLYITAGVTASISGLTLTGFRTQPTTQAGTVGGTIYNAGTLNVSDVVLENNKSDSTNGAGIYNDTTGNLTVTNSTFRNNDAGGFNAAGGGFYNRGTATVSDSTFVGNSVYQFGGGIANVGASPAAPATLTVTRTTIDRNSVFTGFGGGIYNRDGTLTLSDSTLVGNSANNGGGLYQFNAAVTITNTTVTGNGKPNTANTEGGGIRQLAGALSITNSTIVGNISPNGAGIRNQGTLTLGNTIVAGNIGSFVPDIWGDFRTNGNNLIGNNFGAFGTWTGSDLVGTNASPINPLVGPLADNGGPTQTMAPLAGSPALDRGNNSLAVDPVTSQPLTYDQRGAGFGRIVGAAVDIGAFEAGPSNQAPTAGSDSAAVTANEGSTATNTGTFGDPDGNGTVTLTASVGTVIKDDADGTWSWSYAAGDGPAGPTTVTVTATDDFDEIATTTFTLAVDNVAPTATIGNSGPVTYGDSFAVSLSDAFDPSAADTTAGFRYAFSLVDDFTGITYATGSETPSQAFALDAGTYTVYARIIDKDDGFTTYSTEVTVARADATVVVGGYSGTYDAAAHGATGSAVGVGGIDLSAWLDLGTSFTDAPGGTANWYFSGGVNYNDQSGSVAIDIAKADQTISWSDPAGITYGAALSGAQLNATVTGVAGGSAPGALAYATPAGTVLGAGQRALTVTAAATTNYNAATASVTIDVARAGLTVAAVPVTRVYSAATPAFAVTFSGFVNGDGAGDLGGALAFTPSDTTTLAPGTYALTPSGLTSANYTISYASAALTIAPVGVVDGTLIVVGTDGRDIITVTQHGSGYRVDARLAAQWIDHSDDHDWDDSHFNDDDDDCHQYNSRHQHFTFGAADVTAIRIFGLGGNDTLRVGRSVALPSFIDGGAGDDRIWGGAGDDTVVDPAGNNRIHTRRGSDTVTTGAGNDRVWTDGDGDYINVGDGNNEVHAGGGDNVVIAGSGNDDIWTRGGNDYINAGDGNNNIYSGDGDDIIVTGAGKDRIWSDGGNDTISAGDGDNLIRSGAGNDIIVAGSGDDTITSGDGDDFVRAGAGDDLVDGGAGDDVIVGGAGNDLLIGGNGRDFLIGGSGADRIVGNQDEDILIAGYTSFDADDVALLALMGEWTSDRSYAARVANITNGGGVNGLYRLVGDDGASQTVFDDSCVDTLTGSQGTDWFFANLLAGNSGPRDVVTDKTAKELWDDIDF